jgi:hypothetical protein
MAYFIFGLTKSRSGPTGEVSRSPRAWSKKQKSPCQSLNEKSSMCLQALKEMLPDDVSECGPGVAIGVEFDAWRDACLQRLEEGGVANRGTRRSDFKRAKDDLVSHGYITISGSLVNIPW